MARLYRLIVIFTIASLCSPSGALAALLGSCTGGIRTETDYRLAVGRGAGSITDPPAGFVCGASDSSLIRTVPDAAGIALGAATVGATAAAGALSTGVSEAADVVAMSSVALEFSVTRVLPGTSSSVVPVFYDVILTTVRAAVSESEPAFASAGAKGFVVVNSGGSGAGGVPVDHKNGVAASFTIGSSLHLVADSVLIVPDTPYFIQYSVRSTATASASSGATGTGSASADFTAAVSLAALMLAPSFGDRDSYELSLALAADPGAELPGAGIYPMLDPPLSLVPLPASLWLLATAFGALAVGSVGARRKRR